MMSLLLALLGLAAAGLSASGGAPAASRRPVSWLGLYHPVDGAVWGGQGVPNGSSMTDAFRFGIAGVSPGVPWDSGSYRDEWEFLCNTSDLNALWYLVPPPSERGVANNPADTKLWQPCTGSHTPAGCAAGEGIIQAAQRASRLSRT